MIMLTTEYTPAAEPSTVIPVPRNVSSATEPPASASAGVGKQPTGRGWGGLEDVLDQAANGESVTL